MYNMLFDPHDDDDTTLMIAADGTNNYDDASN